MIEIDGKTGEGGGRILRLGCALSCITQQPCRIFDIRKIERQGGLRTQHLTILKALREMCNAHINGDVLGSEEIIFVPGEIQGGNVNLEMKTAGSITLVLHTLLIPAIFAKKETVITIDGGATDTFFSPTINHTKYVLLGLLKKMGVETDLKIERRGFYPKGGGRVELTVSPSSLKSINLVNPGELKSIDIFSGASADLRNQKIVETQLKGAKGILDPLSLPIQEHMEYSNTSATGSYIDMITTTERSLKGVNSIGRMDTTPEEVGLEAAQRLLEQANKDVAIDIYAADQLLPYMALTNKRCKVKTSEITEFTTTNMKIIEMFLPGIFTESNGTIEWTPED